MLKKILLLFLGFFLITPGSPKYFIALERIKNRWQIVWDDWDFLPEYRP